jgi:catechol 2,3-dioxygenase-like lactoylglutathione lyase family enzyme
MDQRISFVTLAVADLERTHAFYVDGLGWAPELYVPGEVLMIRAGDALVFSLWAESGFEGEVGPIRRGEGAIPITLSHNVRTEAEVDEILALASSIGADPVSAGERRDWGGYTGYLEDGTPTGFVNGYSGYFADPDGYRWEIAYNPEQTLAAIVLPEQ